MSRKTKSRDKKHRRNIENNQKKKRAKNDWVNITVDINDGWADDVPLIYPENGWKPDDNELTKVEIEPDIKPAGKKRRRKVVERDINTIIHEDTMKTPRRRPKPFTMFMIIWLGVLSVTIAVALGIFYNFLEKYEAAYQASRSYHAMDNITASVRALDMDSIYNMMTVKPVINEFETEENVKNYMRRLIEGTTIDYKQSEKYTEDFPEYYILADGYIIAKIDLRKEPESSLAYGFPSWYISNFEFYTDAQYSVRLEKPENYSVSVNGINFSDEYCYEDNIENDMQRYFDGYSTLPTLEKYYVDGFYEEPSVSAVSCFGSECEVVFNTTRGIYEVPYADPNNLDEFEDYAISFACDCTNYSTKDAEIDVLIPYFEEDSELLAMYKTGYADARKYVAGHSSSVLENIEITEYAVFDENSAYARIKMDQTMDIWGQETTLEIHIGLCTYMTPEGRKVCYVLYGE